MPFVEKFLCKSTVGGYTRSYYGIKDALTHPGVLRMFHVKKVEQIFNELNTSERGLSHEEARKRLTDIGPNILPSRPADSILKIIIAQFLNPLILTLCVAAIISVIIGDVKDAYFILLVIFINALIGTIQEYSAEKSAQALKQLSSDNSKVIRDGEMIEIESEKLVPGDIVTLESGDRVPADIRLFKTRNFETDESLLTGESLTVVKDHTVILEEHASLGDQLNMAFSGSTVTKGRATGVVVKTGYNTELGQIADVLAASDSAKPPLVIRMEDFTKKISVTLVFISVLMGAYLLSKGESWQDVFIFCIAVIVAAIPEGLPVSMTVALSIASRKMARRNVIVRKLPAVEALGSCTYIATDKTGTLTVNQLTIKQLAFPDVGYIEITGSGLNPDGKINKDHIQHEEFDRHFLRPLVTVGILSNDAILKKEKNNNWQGTGDAVDLSLLTLAHKANISPDNIRKAHPRIHYIPYESENQYAASLNQGEDKYILSLKGAMEKILPLCSHMSGLHGPVPLDEKKISEQSDHLAEQGFKVLAFAMKEISGDVESIEDHLQGLTFVGLIGMLDPLRQEARDSVIKCKKAGIKVAMITGDHPKTSLAIARELELATSMDEVVTGPQLKKADETERTKLISNSRVFARVDPQQKLSIINTLIKKREFIAVTGDGANDAPALNAANVGIAMGKSGTDVAKETADLIISDDRFASIVAGVEEGRIAYSNIRKVIYLLISTGVAELILITLSLFFDTPMPLTAIQILWLNLVTNGIQDKGLAFEPGEGDELTYKPRNPEESIFDKLMIERIVISGVFMGVITFSYFSYLIDKGEELTKAQNITLLLMVLFENLMILNCRSEIKSAFALNIFRNKFLLIGTICALLVHVSTMFIPALRDVLGTSPLDFTEWIQLPVLAFSIVIIMEIYKYLRRRQAESYLGKEINA